jgi:hypothetical protein
VPTHLILAGINPIVQPGCWLVLPVYQLAHQPHGVRPHCDTASQGCEAFLQGKSFVPALALKVVVVFSAWPASAMGAGSPARVISHSSRPDRGSGLKRGLTRGREFFRGSRQGGSDGRYLCIQKCHTNGGKGCRPGAFGPAACVPYLAESR